MRLPKYSIGVGDRFAREGCAQLDAVILAMGVGVNVAPVWNKSHREHSITGSCPSDVRAEVDHAVRTRSWNGAYFVDADHINLGTVDAFVESSDFFTLDVADRIGVDPGADATAEFVASHRDLVGSLVIPGIDRPLEITDAMLGNVVKKYLTAIHEAGRIYRRIESVRGAGNMVIEVSMDETNEPQTPVELLLILAAMADEKIPAQTIAPRFSGRFNKGVDYVGNVERFVREFQADLAVVDFAVRRFNLPENLKLSIHSGSDKFSLYPQMRESLRKFDAGVHLKTAGTTWLEEVIALATAGGDGLQIAKEICLISLDRLDELCAPYASVVDIDRTALPIKESIETWDGEAFVKALRHDQTCGAYNPSLRQLMHVGYRVAGEMGDRFTSALEKHADMIAVGVTNNLFQRHIRPLFLGKCSNVL